MALPLQPDLTPASSWVTRVLPVGALGVLLVLAAWLSGPRVRLPQVLADGPGRDAAALGAATRLIAGARERVWVAMYVIRPDEDGPVGRLLDALAAARARGVEVRILLDLDEREPEKNQTATAWLRDRGIHVVLDEPTVTSHAKVLLVDQREALVGSHNWTRSAMTRNREVSVVVADRASLDELAGWFAGIPGWAGP